MYQEYLIARHLSRRVLAGRASQCPHRRCHWRSCKSESTTTSFGPDLYTYRANIRPAASEPGVIRLGPRLVDQCHGQGVLHGQDECGAGTARGAIESTHGAYQREGMAGAYIDASKVIKTTKGPAKPPFGITFKALSYAPRSGGDERRT